MDETQETILGTPHLVQQDDRPPLFVRESNPTPPESIDSSPRFTPIPECVWSCARINQQHEFIGHTTAQPILTVPKPFLKFLARIFRHSSEVENALDFLQNEVPIYFPEARPPPKERYVVFGIFHENGSLLHEDIVYLGQRLQSKRLVWGRRKMFRLPILRDIHRFGLYKCDQEKRTHFRVNLRIEDENSLAALFACVQKWEAYHETRSTLNFRELASESILNGILYQFYYIQVPAFTQWTRTLIHGTIKAPSPVEENAWCKWIDENINAGKDDPAAGHYSIECVIRWSRTRITLFVIFPFILAVVSTTVFGFVWSFDIGRHKGDAPGGFTIASYFAALATAVVALIAFFGGLSSK